MRWGTFPLQKPSFVSQRERTAGAGLGVLAAVIGWFLLASQADAQAPPGIVQPVPPGRDRAGPTIPAQPDFNFSIVAPHRSPVPRAVDEVHFKLTDIKIEGAVTIPASRLQDLYTPLLGKDVTLADILNVADKIEALYRAQGYILVRAFVPPQRVKDGVFTINVVEGYLASITVQGGDPTTRSLIGEYLDPARAARPLTLLSMERGLLLANDIPGVAATGVLRPAPDTPGASDLVVDTLQPWISGGIAVDNRGSRFSGLWTINGDVELGPIFGADQLAGNVTLSPSSIDQVAGQVRYRRAIGGEGLIASLIGSITHGQPGSTLTAFNVRTDSWAVGPRLTFPLIRSRAETLVLDGGFTVQDARVELLSTGFSHDQWRVLDIGGSYQRTNILGGTWTSTFDIAQGLPILGATPNKVQGNSGPVPNPILSRFGGLTDFTKMTGFTRLALPVAGALSAVFSVQGQYAFVPLITGEQITFGGTQIGRGYDPGGITGDQGVGGSAELRYDFHFAESFVHALQPYIFVDAARTWYIHGGSDLPDQSIASVGGGLRFWLPYNLTASTEVAQTLNRVVGSDANQRATKLLIDLSVRF